MIGAAAALLVALVLFGFVARFMRWCEDDLLAQELAEWLDKFAPQAAFIARSLGLATEEIKRALYRMPRALKAAARLTMRDLGRR